MPSLGPSLPLSPPPCLLPPAGDGQVHSRLALLWNCSVLPLLLSNAACSSLFSPHLLVADGRIWGTFLRGIAFRHVICGFYLFFLLVMLPSEIWKFPPDPPVRGFPGVWKLPLLWFPSHDRRKWQPTPVFLPDESHRQRSLVGYSPRGHKSWTRLSDYTNSQ